MKALCISLLCIVSGSFACSASPNTEAEAGTGEDDVRAASTTLTIPLVGTEYDEAKSEYASVALESLNAALEAEGLAPFTASVTLTRADEPTFAAILDRLDVANEKLGRSIEFGRHYDAAQYPGICYVGIVSGVRKTVDALSGSVFDDNMSMAAYRYKNTRKFVYGTPDEEADFLEQHREENADAVDAWEAFDVTSNDFLMLTNLGPQGDGTELYASVIPRCL